MDPNSGKLKKRHSYYEQIQLGMLMHSLHECNFTLYSSKNDGIYVDLVMFDEKFCLEMLEILTEIYFKYVLPYISKNTIFE